MPARPVAPVTVQEDPIEEFFPWPPRWPTSRWHPAADLFADQQRYRTLGDVDDYLLKKIHAADYHQYGHFRIKNSGFAIVTKIERINDKGEPDPQQRFDSSLNPTSSFNLAEYCYRLLFGGRGRFRVFVFIFTPEPVNPVRGTHMDFPLVVSWEKAGASYLPPKIRAVPVTADHKLSILVYEFTYREGETEVPHALPDGGIDPGKQLEAANLRLLP
jgi:hypothetical protein